MTTKVAFPRIGWKTSSLRLCTGLLFFASTVAHSQDAACGDPFHNHFGPFDYRTATKGQRDIVESYHFTAAVATLRHGESTNKLGADISYTLRVFPNHPRALLAMSDLARREKTIKPQGTEYPVSCWFERAIQFRPDDGTVRLVYGISLARDGKSKEALEQLQKADKLIPNDANVHYNLGLVYFELKDYENSLKQAKIAYGLGFPLGGLRSKLESVHEWR
jgi:predicted Zn-dependent protease